MLGIVYLLAMVAVGDHLARRFLPSASIVHRLSAAFLVGLLLSTWITYLSAAAFAGLDMPLMVGNIVFLGLAAYVLRGLPRMLFQGGLGARRRRLMRALRHERRDVVVLTGLLLLTSWLMFSTFGTNERELLISNVVHSDFGSTTAISQSFAAGSNFPTVYPHFAGEPIRYHFLFYFQAGNLTFLGLNPALSLNLLSVLSFGALLGTVMTLGRVLFRSAAVGWLGGILFFLHGSLAWIPFVAAQPSVEAAWNASLSRTSFLPSGFPFRGEEWGVWTMTIFANQRHFASGIALLLLVMIFLVQRYRRAGPGADGRLLDRLRVSWQRTTGWVRSRGWPRPSELRSPSSLRPADAASFAFAGLLLGALPIWNGAVFVAAFAVLALLFLLFPIDRRYLIILAAVAALVSLPQLAFLRPSAGANAPYPAFYWGYTIDDPTPLNVAWYIAFTFGPKLLLAGTAFLLLGGLQRKVLLAATGLLVVAFTVQFSAEVLVNHKFLNIWLVVLNLFAAYGLIRLWRARPVRGLTFGRLTAGILALVIALGGLIDLMPFRNGYMLGVPYTRDPLVSWVQRSSDPHDVFLSHIYVAHPILASGRSLFLGWTYYAWSAGYEMGPREDIYRRMFTEQDPQVLARLLHENGIAYVVFDDQLRQTDFVEAANEEVYAETFPEVFASEDYYNIRIFAVP